MKVYFEETGCGGDGRGNKTISITAYVNPTGDGHAYKFDCDGCLHLFAWCNENQARCFDSKDIPVGLWRSIQFGKTHITAPFEKAGYAWSFKDLKYIRVSKDEARKAEIHKQVMKEIPAITTLDEFKQLYPRIKESGRIDMLTIRKLFELVGVKEIPVWNGEIGLAFFQNQMLFKRTLKEYGIE